ncbi:S24 family peptidase [Actinomadura sp. NPDC049753]|uniref:S24 family peptidase n=1 Tax=Actinomadura sp. NPDC049753 TaxID=3154739 RepID=UPI0034187A27
MDAIAARVAEGATVDFRPSGSSMVPLIRSGDLVTVAPVDPARLEVGDIVLARVAGMVYLHLVSALDPTKGRVQISNNRGRINGWTGRERVFGICVAVRGDPRPGALAKAVAPEPEAQASDHDPAGSSDR